MLQLDVKYASHGAGALVFNNMSGIGPRWHRRAQGRWQEVARQTMARSISALTAPPAGQARRHGEAHHVQQHHAEEYSSLAGIPRVPPSLLLTRPPLRQ